ncbi:hypothetical protein BpHYR1_033992 [Brachionus plicatilis]|uniref:Uncharacterized protein n=1 Tax=Brachionus plicatilis TaxID=10195 RepID=A0A3M7R3Z7_BRAPC|nr:hypothetical protein BpHYR1_033992 [Brachionus plicatilis]
MILLEMRTNGFSDVSLDGEEIVLCVTLLTVSESMFLCTNSESSFPFFIKSKSLIKTRSVSSFPFDMPSIDLTFRLDSKRMSTPKITSLFKFLAIMNTAFNCLEPIVRDSVVCPMVFKVDPFAVIQFFGA